MNKNRILVYHYVSMSLTICHMSVCHVIVSCQLVYYRIREYVNQKSYKYKNVKHLK